MKFIFCVLGAIALSGITACEVKAATKTYKGSAKVWSQYYPNTNCSVNECAKYVPTKALEEFLEKSSYYYPDKLSGATWMMLADFTMHSSEKRGFLINTKTGNSLAYHVGHGVGSGDGNGNAIRFSNTSESKMSSKGLYVTAETYSGKHGYSLRMDGKESTNSKARERSIVIHGAEYMSRSFIKGNQRAGRSWGCPAVDSVLSRDLIDKLKNGSLYYIYAN